MYAGKPDAEDEFNKLELSGLTVFVDKTNPIGEEGLNVHIKAVGRYKRLVVDGFIL